MVPEYSGGVPLIQDNAQNWYRHQVAEFGLVGSLPWLVWVLTFGWFVLRPRAGEPPIAWTARGALIGFAFISLVGMPAQELNGRWRSGTRVSWGQALARAV
jgi:hypothetical protein